MIGQTRRGIAPPVSAPRRTSALVPSLWVINALLVGVVILAPASKQASTSPVDSASQVVSATGDVTRAYPVELTEYLGEQVQGMQSTDKLVVSAPPAVTEVHALTSSSRAVAHLQGECPGGEIVLDLSHGSYRGKWVDIGSSKAVDIAKIRGGSVTLVCPAFSGAIVLDIQKI